MSPVFLRLRTGRHSIFCQYGFMLPKVLSSESLTVRLCCHDLTTHHWERESQLAWSAYWAQRCIWSPRGCPWKKQSTVRRLYDGLNAGWESNVRSPGAKWNIHKAVCLLWCCHRNACYWRKKMLWWKKLGRITITATACKRLHAFWYRTTGCTDIHLFINLFKAAVSLCLYVPWWRQALEIHDKCLSKVVCRVFCFFFTVLCHISALLWVCFLKAHAESQYQCLCL